MNDKTVKFTIECEMRERWVPVFLGMLKCMEKFGNVGHSGMIHFYSDGDGDYRPQFGWNDSLPSPDLETDLQSMIRLEQVFDAG